MIIINITKDTTYAKNTCTCSCCGATIEFDCRPTAEKLKQVARCPVCGADSSNLTEVKE